MKKTLIVTTFDEVGYYKYAYKMLDSMESYLNREVDLHAYHQECSPSDLLNTRFTLIDFDRKLGYYHDKFCDLSATYTSNKIKGRVNSKEYEDSRSFLYDAVRFSYKWFTMIDAFKENHDKYDYLMWLDADTEAYDTIDQDFIDSLIGIDDLLSYLGRTRPYTETGFVLFNLNHPLIGKFFERMKSMYYKGEIFSLPQWIDCVAFDAVRTDMENIYGCRFRNLTPGDHGSVWNRSPLASRMIHNKGPDK